MKQWGNMRRRTAKNSLRLKPTRIKNEELRLGTRFKRAKTAGLLAWFTLWKAHLSGWLVADLVILLRCDVFGSWFRNMYFPLRLVLVLPLSSGHHSPFWSCSILFISKFGVGKLLLQSKKAPHLLFLILYNARHFRRRGGKSCCTSDLYSATTLP